MDQTTDERAPVPTIRMFYYFIILEHTGTPLLVLLLFAENVDLSYFGQILFILLFLNIDLSYTT